MSDTREILENIFQSQLSESDWALVAAELERVIGDIDPTPPTEEWVKWGGGMQQFLIGRNNKVIEIRKRAGL